MRKTARTGTSRAPSKIDLAGLVSERVQIRDVHLVESSARRQSSRGPGPNRLDVTIGVSTELHPEENRIVVHAKLSLVGRLENEQTREERLRIEVLNDLAYGVHSTEGLGKEHLAAFGELNGVYHIWPYWREYVQSTCARMGFPTLTMPVLPPKMAGQSAGSRTRTT